MAIQHVDFVPRQNISGDFMEISEYDRAKWNTIVTSLLLMLNMEPGKLHSFPQLGVRNKLLNILYHNDPIGQMQEITAIATQHLGYTINVNSAVKDERDKTHLDFVFGIEGLPGQLQMGMEDSGGFVKIVNPQVIL